jgi:hypothetical protein
MIFNIRLGCFGGPMRMGDLVACANVVEHFRQTENNPDIKFYIDAAARQASSHVAEFFQILCQLTDYFSAEPGSVDLPWRRVNLWDYRDIAGDLVHIPNPVRPQQRIVVAPLLDADYNTYRNWPQSVVDKIITEVNEQYPDHERIIATMHNISRPGWRTVSNLVESVELIQSAQVYYGGDTGLSHFVGALASGPEPIYYTSSRGLLHTTPINWYTKRKGTMRTYWLDFENTQW